METRAYHKNPADLGSHGEPVLQAEELWWRGPEWLLDSENWPAYVTTSATKETLAEVKTVLELFKLATEKKRTISANFLSNGTSGACCGVAQGSRDSCATPRLERRTKDPLKTAELEDQNQFWEKRSQRDGQMQLSDIKKTACRSTYSLTRTEY